MTPKQVQALILMLNAIRLELFAAQMHETSAELKDCLVQSARLSHMAMGLVDLVDEEFSPSTGSRTE
jgi:hypothetical protein